MHLYLLKSSFFNPIDMIILPLAVLVLYLISRNMLRRQDQLTKKFFFQSFWIRLIMVFLFAMVIQFYYGGGDAFRYYISILDMRKAIDDGAVSFWDIMSMEKSDKFNPLYNYFAIDELGENQFYMRTPENFAVPKVGLIFSLIFQDSYLAISLCFSFIALLGSYQIYSIFSAYFPDSRKHIAIACFYIPTVCFWSSGILKDSLTFGAVGLLMGGVYSIFIRRRRILQSVLIILVSIYLLYAIKPYILIAFAPALILFIFTQWSAKFSSRSAKRIAFAFMLILGIVSGIAFYQYFTSEGALQQYSTDNIFNEIEAERNVYERMNMRQAGSYYSLGSTNPFLMFPLGIVATYFRPFLFEVNNPVMLLSALESTVMVLLVIFVISRVGFLRTFRIIFSNPFALFCFIFSIFFGGAIGLSTGNFGTLVRYKIPGMPFFLLTILIVLHLTGTKLPKWTRKIGFLQNKPHVRHRRIHQP